MGCRRAGGGKSSGCECADGDKSGNAKRRASLREKQAQIERERENARESLLGSDADAIKA